MTAVEMPNFMVSLVEIWMLAMGALGILIEVFLGKRSPHLIYFWVQTTLIGAIGLSVLGLGHPVTVTWQGLYIADPLGNLLKIFIGLSSLGAFYYGRTYVALRKIPGGEYYILGLFSTLGMFVLVAAHSLITIYLGLEIISLPLYAMISLQRERTSAIEASLKYFIMGAIASAMLLYGMSILYGATGSLDISAIAAQIHRHLARESLMLTFALVFIVAGIGFKLASVPFHMWAPDVYVGSPTSVTLFLSTGPKIAAVGMAFRLLVFALPALHPSSQKLLILLALFSTLLGNLLAIAQKNIKRMLAYSGIGHMGFMLFGLLAGTPDGYAAALFYILTYAIMALAAFGLIVLMSHAGFESENIDDFKGLNHRSPWLAFMMMLVMFSMAGVPPTVGFFIKLWVLKAVVDVGLLWMAVFGLLVAACGAYYYIRIVKTMYFDEPLVHEPLVITRDLRLFFSCNALALLWFGMFPQALIHLCLKAFHG